MQKFILVFNMDCVNISLVLYIDYAKNLHTFLEEKVILWKTSLYFSMWTLQTFIMFHTLTVQRILLSLNKNCGVKILLCIDCLKILSSFHRYSENGSCFANRFCNIFWLNLFIYFYDRPFLCSSYNSSYYRRHKRCCRSSKTRFLLAMLPWWECCKLLFLSSFLCHIVALTLIK